MTPEWEELKNKLKNEYCNVTDSGHCDHRYPNGIKFALETMAEIERRTLPERVAKILRDSIESRKTFTEESIDEDGNSWGYYLENVAKALESGEISKLERWQR